MKLGILLGLATAVIQSFSYLASAVFIKKHGSAFKLLIFSQVAMGAISAFLLPFCFPGELISSGWKGVVLLLLWITMFGLGQTGFFFSQKFIESSRLASMLGLKIVVLSLIWIFFYRRDLNFLQVSGALLSVIAAFVMNWSGSKGFGLKGGATLALTLICFSMTDLVETEIVLLVKNCSVVRAGTATTLFCYTVLGILSLPMLFKTGWNIQIQRDSLLFALLWLGSQITLLICFGLIGPVFGNVIQSSRGIFSVIFGVLAFRIGIDAMENKATPGIWIRRGLAALLMAAGVACFSFGKISV